MKAVWKYPLPIIDNVEISIPKGSKILCVKTQKNDLCLWALVNPDENETESVKLRIAGTGHPIEEENLEYIDTVLMYEDNFVIHIFKIV